MRIWRDALDVRTLLVEQDSRAVILEAMDVARAHDLDGPLLALLRFVEPAAKDGGLPELVAGEADPAMVARLFRLYQSGAFLAVPPSTLKNVRRLALTSARRPWALWGMAVGAMRRDRVHHARREEGLKWMSREQRAEEGKGFLMKAVGKGAAFAGLLLRSEGRALRRLLGEQDALRSRYGRVFRPMAESG